jgi:hypothetical protein
VSLRNSTTPHRAAFRKDLEIVEAGISLLRLRSKPAQQFFVDLGFQCYASDPFFHKELLKLICNDLKPTEEQIVRYAFFAGSTLNWPTTQILPTAEANLRALGILTRSIPNYRDGLEPVLNADREISFGICLVTTSR